jgi:hypothetical protein
MVKGIIPLLPEASPPTNIFPPQGGYAVLKTQKSPARNQLRKNICPEGRSPFFLADKRMRKGDAAAHGSFYFSD